MPDLLQELEAELTRLRIEYETIKRVRDRIRNGASPEDDRFPTLPEDRDQEPASAPAQHRPRKPAAEPTPRQQKPGSREAEVLLTLQANPGGLTIPQLAALMPGSSEKYLYRGMPRLLRLGRVKARNQDGVDIPAGTQDERFRQLAGHNPRWYLAAEIVAPDPE